MTNEQNLFLVTKVAASGDGFVGRLYLTREQAEQSIGLESYEFVEPVVIRDAAEPESDLNTALGWLETWLQVNTGPTEAERVLVTSLIAKHQNREGK